MSFGSDYLKLRKERAGTSSGGTEQNAAPPEEKSTAATESSFNQNYMALRKQRDSMTISEKVEKRVQALKSAQQAASPADVLDGGRRIGKKNYYTRPEFGARNERLYSDVSALDSVLAEKRAPLDAAAETLRKAETDLKAAQSYAAQAQRAYQQDPSAENAAYYNQAAGAYEQARGVYDGAFDTYSAAYGAYKPYEEQYIEALTAYRFYNEQQSAAFDDWRGTIRDAATILQEIQNADARAAKLESDIGSLTALTRGRTDALGASMRETLRKATEELRDLQQSRALLQEEYEWSRHYQYADLTDASDFGAKSGYVSTANGKEAVLHPLSGLYTETGFGDLTYDYINRNEDARGKALVNSIADNTAMLGLDTSYLQQMTDDEIAIFNYLYATQGPDAAYEYTAYLKTTLTQRQRMAQEAQWAQYAAEKPVAASVFSVAMSPLKGISFLGQAADKAADGTIDQNAAYNKFSYAGSSIRNQVSEQISKSGKWGEAGSFLYQTGMSMGDFLLNTAITGGNQTLSLAIMGTGAAADTVIAGKDRGLTDDQAFTLGAVAGLAEIAMEKISLDTLLNPSLLRNGSVKYVLKNMVAEGGEEVGTDLINLFADILIAKDQSEWQQSIDSYAAQGMSEKEAFGAALKDQLLTMGADFLGGALSGGIMSSAGAIAGNRFTNKQAQELEELDLSDEDIQAFIETGLESAPDTDAYHIAREMKQKLDAGQELSSNDLSRLYQANIQAVYEEQQTEEQPEGLTLRGVDAEETAPAPVTQSQGKEAENNAAPWQQEPEWNGGTVHGEYEQNGRSAAAQPGARPAAGEYVLHGGAERAAGQSAGEQPGSHERRSAQRAENYHTADAAATERRIKAENLERLGRLERVSARDIGIRSGTERKELLELPQYAWDEELYDKRMQKIYNRTRSEILNREIGEVMGSPFYKDADDATKAKMLSRLYDYAAEKAKATSVPEYEASTSTTEWEEIAAAGGSVADCTIFKTITSKSGGQPAMKSWQKADLLLEWDAPDRAKEMMFQHLVSDSQTDEITALKGVGVSFDQFLAIYSRHGEIDAEDLTAREKATHFAYWLDGQRFSDEQKAAIKTELEYRTSMPADSDRYDKAIAAGMSRDEALELAGELNGLQAEEGADSVSDLQKWRASVDFSDDVEDQLTALYVVMKPEQYQKVEIANDFGVTPELYVTLHENKRRFDVNGNGSLTNAEAKAAVDNVGAHCTKEQKAVMWQLLANTTSAKNNPYSSQIGQKVLDAKAAAKEAAAQEEELEGLTLGNW